MPFYLKESDALAQTDGLGSVLIVPCRFCPAASLAVRERKPYIELLRRFLRTAPYESFIRALKHRLQKEGIEATVFDSKWPHQFVGCMWTAKRRKKLAKRAAQFDSVVVLGCDAMGETVREAIGSDGGRIIQGMESEGVMNVLPALSFPLDLSLVVQGITPVVTTRPTN